MRYITIELDKKGKVGQRSHSQQDSYRKHGVSAERECDKAKDRRNDFQV